MSTSMQTDLADSHEKVESLKVPYAEILTIFPNVHEIYCSLQRVSRIHADFSVGQADFEKFISQHFEKNNSEQPSKAAVAFLRERIDGDLCRSFQKYDRKLKILRKNYKARSEKSLTILSPNFTPFEIDMAYSQRSLELSQLRVSLSEIDFTQEALSKFKADLDKLIDDYAVLSKSMWDKINEFEKFHQDKWRYWAAILGMLRVVAGVLIALSGFVIADVIAKMGPVIPQF